MGEGYRVDLHALQQAAAGVNGTLDELNQQSVSGIPHDPTAIGNGDLASTLGDFLDRWQRGVSNLAKDGQEIAARLTASLNAYRRADQSTADQLTGTLQGNGADPGAT
ncbi:hypothetical protein OG455_17740 [Kitasatospora sp. NBC_01287]|uniref:hypothetical protein n=1 Tax=Kitasatospora sp. NBC_01287 TaxID=2903573 RepID=UPI002254CC3D|nr:hypothetical protein [Kitasatospora sp. NBC_01287]MCX4747341.1 hypothetical protein [Kitasatospora sp. NBC_01287]